MKIHQVYSGPAVIVTLYDWVLPGKCTISLLLPETGLKSLRMARTHDSAGFVGASIMLLIVAACSGWALFL